MPDKVSERAINNAFEAVNTTVTHLGRIVGLVAGAAGRAAQEVKDLVWDYRDLASEVRKPAE
ncbi:hypothetical protein A5753_12680 [Mycobacterium sp. 852002-51971_SCH5477799-a]|uniref:hypothetical protein n=1 Tax=Mycobacterium sp. 852002-51971_SCH5477799-a TaxID=1834106 RepID=UPI0008024BBB|nr:hypothetical protein [Mycobacterium sp. 852002-51971_SCH5477799-a]OBF63359.1 hypothetical protein A5753_12680 [Mycobacterium sp. 852002-51971_SCH5477799-a]